MRLTDLSDPDFDSVLASLAGPRIGLAAALPALPRAPGLYAVYGRPDVWLALRLGEPPDGRPLYVGKSESSLQGRDVDTHFGDGQTGWSTVRRSVAALLHDELGLRGMPRKPDNPSHFPNYGLSPEQELELTKWMRSHLELSVWERHLTVDLGELETDVLAVLRPPLNLQKVRTPWTQNIKRRRAGMADEARAWARQQGFDC